MPIPNNPICIHCSMALCCFHLNVSVPVGLRGFKRPRQAWSTAPSARSIVTLTRTAETRNGGSFRIMMMARRSRARLSTVSRQRSANRFVSSTMTPETRALAEQLVRGQQQQQSPQPSSTTRSRAAEADAAVAGSGSWRLRAAISKAITLVESRAPQKQEQAAALLTHLLEHDHSRDKDHFRIGM